MIRLREALRSRDVSDAGTSLVEMLVTILLFAIIMAVVATAYIQGVRSENGGRLRNEATDREHNAIEVLTKDLRTAVAPDPLTTSIQVADPTEMDLYSNVSVPGNAAATGPTSIRFWFDSATSSIKETQIAAVANPVGSVYPYSWPVARAVTTVLLGNVVVPATHPIFTYFAAGDVSPASVPGSTKTSLVSDADGGISAQGLQQIAGIDIWLDSGANKPYHVPDTVLVGYVTLINSGNASLDNA